ncbi:MAG: abortive infection family protein [Candidatus Rokuibacteriota bacterium]
MISKQTRLAFREHLVGWTLRTISDLFYATDIDRGSPETLPSGARRALVEEYYAGVDWSSGADTRKVARVYEEVLQTIESHLAEPVPGAPATMSKKEFDKLVNLLRRDGFAYESGRLVPTSGVDLRDLPIASATVDRHTLHDHIKRIEDSVDSDPSQAIGSTKELVETVAKLVLLQYGEDPDQHATLQQLVKHAFKCLDLSIETIPEARKGAEAIRQILSGLSQIVGGTAELRNLYGTGHGRVRRGGLAPRHARLVVGAGATLSRFLLETLDARKGPSPSL